ncbi:ompA family protein [Burkholderia sp. MSHR3999]|uniref:OmpA family protein n=1 Tax=Burkholderia sp. MSHR3999 TaxID=1542965 RepID=UPI0005B6BF40|nr:ompA family protein [Burkholderia sp. MSHR3999]
MMKMMTTALFSAVVLTGCSSASGPTFDAYSVTLPNQQQAFRVRCDGLLEGQGTCEAKAREICGNAQVRPIEAVAPYSSGADARLLTFQCGVPPQAAPAPQPAPAPVPAPPRKITLNGDANFDFDKATLRPDASARLDQLVAQARGMSFRSVTVDGYTDALGSIAYNQGLSERRAQTVATYLHDRGLNAQQFIAHGYGKTNPIATNATDIGRAQNRRVEILLDPTN